MVTRVMHAMQRVLETDCLQDPDDVFGARRDVASALDKLKDEHKKFLARWASLQQWIESEESK